MEEIRNLKSFPACFQNQVINHTLTCALYRLKSIGKEIAIYLWLLWLQNVTRSSSFAVISSFMICLPKGDLFRIIIFKLKLMYFKKYIPLHFLLLLDMSLPMEGHKGGQCLPSWLQLSLTSANLSLLGCKQWESGTITYPPCHLATAESRIWRQPDL